MRRVGRQAVKANAAPTRSTQSHRRCRHTRGKALRDGLPVVSWPAQPGGVRHGISAFRQRRQRSADFERVARWCYRPSVVVAASRGTWTRFRRIVGRVPAGARSAARACHGANRRIGARRGPAKCRDERRYGPQQDNRLPNPAWAGYSSGGIRYAPATRIPRHLTNRASYAP